jgi:hypothetical protein
VHLTGWEGTVSKKNVGKKLDKQREKTAYLFRGQYWYSTRYFMSKRLRKKQDDEVYPLHVGIANAKTSVVVVPHIYTNMLKKMIVLSYLNFLWHFT